MTDLWMYDAKRNDPLTALRIPVLSNPYPSLQYVVALFINDGGPYGPALRPDEREVAQIAAYLKYRMEPYGPYPRMDPRDAAQLAEERQRPFDTFEFVNTVILQKRGDGSWCYRRFSWRNDAPMAPAPDGERLGLERLLDMIESSDEATAQAWAAWKAAHPEAFR